jgi:hypothetical protein
MPSRSSSGITRPTPDPDSDPDPDADADTDAAAGWVPGSHAVLLLLLLPASSCRCSQQLTASSCRCSQQLTASATNELTVQASRAAVAAAAA